MIMMVADRKKGAVQPYEMDSSLALGTKVYRNALEEALREPGTLVTLDVKEVGMAVARAFYGPEYGQVSLLADFEGIGRVSIQMSTKVDYGASWRDFNDGNWTPNGKWDHPNPFNDSVSVAAPWCLVLPWKGAELRLVRDRIAGPLFFAAMDFFSDKRQSKPAGYPLVTYPGVFDIPWMAIGSHGKHVKISVKREHIEMSSWQLGKSPIGSQE